MGQKISRRTFLGGGIATAAGTERMNMEHCINHPDKEARFACLKHHIYMCEECMRCRDPQIYCKFRSACPIHFITKKKEKLDRVKPAADRERDKKAKVA